MCIIEKLRPLGACSLILFAFASAPAQNSGEDILIDLSESFAEGENTNIDFELLSEEIDLLAQSKIELNRASIDDLLRIPGISQIEAGMVVAHRKRYGAFLSLYELKCVGLSERQLDIIRQHTYLAEARPKSIRQRLRNNESTLFLRYDRTLEKKKGFRQDDTTLKSPYLGDPNHYYVKFKTRMDDLLSFGFSGEKDAGEPFWRDNQKIFDFQSGFLQINNLGIFKRICLGDFKANFGQGLVIGTSSIIGKSNNVLNSLQRNRGLFPYTSIGESGFLRGGGATIGWKALEGSYFYSNKGIDANLSDDGFITSFKTDGLHRTENEMTKKKSTREELIGANLSYNSDRLKLGGTFLAYRYGDTLQPAAKPYNLHKLQTTDRHWNASLDYSLYIKRLFFFGEAATDANHGRALLGGCRIFPSSRAGFLIVYRKYSPDYQANFANGFAENSRIENEEGLYVGSEFKPMKRLIVSLYADAYSFPWMRYSASRPHSSGYDYLGHLSMACGKGTSSYLKYKEKRSEKDLSGMQGTAHDKKQILRFGVRCKRWQPLQLQTIAEGNRHQFGSVPCSYGWMAAQDIEFPIQKANLKISLRYAYFHTPQYENRIYLYEKDILHVFSIPCHYGIGHRACLNLQWNICNRVTAYMKYGVTLYTDDRETIGSGNEEINGSKSSAGKILLRIKL